MSTKTISLDFYNHNIEYLKAKQYDTERYVNIVCTSYGKPVFIDSNTVTAFVKYKRSDGNIVFNGYDETIVINDDGTITVKLTGTMLSSPGQQTFELVLVKSEGLNVDNLSSIRGFEDLGSNLISTMPFYVHVIGSAFDDSEVTSLSEFSALTNALTRMTTIDTSMRSLHNMVNDAEDKRVEAEKSRINVEISRVSAENARKAAENARDSAESSRVAAEEGRVEAESSRVEVEANRVIEEGKRVTAEETRVSAETNRVKAEESRVIAEGLRDQAEIKRQDAETGEAYRISNENVRIAAENIRQTGEFGETYRQEEERKRQEAEVSRVEVESNRVIAEESRVDAEDARVESESSRASAEAARVESEENRAKAESDRVTAFNDSIESYNTTFDNKINEYTAQVDTVIQRGEDLITDINEAVNSGGIYQSEKGSANGVATLDESGNVPSEQLPIVDTIESALVSAGYIFDAQALATLISGLHVVHTGTEDPSNDLGKDGDIYMKIIVDDTEEGTENQGGE